MDQPSNFELEVIVLILQREAKEYPELLAKVHTLQVVGREYSGVGFFTDFEPQSVDRIKKTLPNLVLGTRVTAKIPNLKYDTGFALYITDSSITMLEGYTYGENWLGPVGEFELT
jgi:hypothetical protein